MTIVCLGWGSLIWNQCRADELLTVGGWHSDGPHLPIEFARQSDDGRITLVITPGAKLVPVLWAELDVQSLDKAIASLAKREGPKGGKPTSLKNIGQCPGGHSGPGLSEIAAWRSDSQVEHVIWAALPPRFGGVVGHVPSCPEVVRYLMGLSDDKAVVAAKYIRNTPPQIQTDFRAAIVAALDRRDARS